MKNGTMRIIFVSEFESKNSIRFADVKRTFDIGLIQYSVF